MTRRWLRPVALLSIALLAGCGGGGGGGGGATPPNPPSAGGTPVSVTFSGTSMPTAVALAIGTGSFAAQTLSGGHLTFTLPQGTKTYQLAYHCPPYAAMGMADDEYIIDANVSDGTSPVLSCYAPAAGSNVSIAVNALGIGAASNAGVVAGGNWGGFAGAASGTVNTTFPNGTYDVAALALDSGNNIVGVKFARNQTIPGILNGGNPIVLGATDQTTTSTMTVAGIPSGFNPTPAYNIAYVTANGTSFGLNRSSTSTYAVVPAANQAAGDAYQFESNDADSATNQHVGATAYASTGGPVTVTLPAAWVYTGPAAAAYPSFTFAYSGFTGLTVTDHGSIFWQENPTTEAGIQLYVTPAYLGSGTTASIPNLATLTGFLAAAASGTHVSVVSEIDAGASLSYLNQQQTTGTQSYVQNDSTYVEP